MWNLLLHFFSSPEFPDSEEKKRQVQALNAVLNSQLFTLGVVGGFGLLFIFVNKLVTGIAILAAIFMTLFMKVLLNARYIRFVGLLNSFLLWPVITFLVFVSGGISSTDSFFYLALVIMTGITVGLRWAFGFAVVSVLTLFAIAMVERAGYMFPQWLPLPPESRWLIFTIAIIWALVPLSITLQRLEQAIRQARRELQDRSKVEQTLRENEERYRLISTVSSDYSFSTGLGSEGELHLNWVGGAFEKITGYSYEEYVAHGGWLASLHPDDLEQDVRDMQALHANQSVVTEIRTFHKHGEIRWVRTYAHPVWDEHQQRLVGIIGAVQDITERKQAEIALRESEEKYRTLVEAFPDIIIISALNGDILYANTNLELQSGYTLDDLKPPNSARLIHPEDRELIWNAIQELNSTERKITNLIENRVIDKFGQLRWYSGIMAKTTYMGQPALQTVTRDITDRKQFEEELKRSLERERRQVKELSLLQAASLAAASDIEEDILLQAFVYIVGDAFRADVFGLALWDEETEVLRGHPASQGLHLELLQMPVLPGQGILGKVAATRQPICIGDVRELEEYVPIAPEIRAELCVPIEAGERLIGVINVESKQPNAFGESDERLLLTLAGQLASALERIRAMTSLRQLNTELESRVRERTIQLEAANKELEAFSYSVSHDLRAPLRGIEGFSALLEQAYADQLDETGLHYLKRVRESTKRMNQLINDLLLLARLGRQEIKKKEANPSQIIQETLSDFQPQIKRHQVDIASDLPVCMADPSLLRQVFVNLLENALKYSGKRENPRIEIGWQNQAGEVVYYVRDNGVGFNMKFADKLFGVFQRLHRAEEFEGTGVGLATVHQIITRHGGRIWAEAEVDKGATFYFTLGTVRTIS